MLKSKALLNFLRMHEPADRVLLLGNGINRLRGGNYSWRTLLKELISFSGIDEITLGSNKPLPLLFEEILHQMPGESFDFNLKNLKTKVKTEIDSQLKTNEYHGKIMRSSYNEILTTNYDYLLEKSINSKFVKHKKSGKTSQYLYSDKRVNLVNGKYIWHIHGELDNGYNSSGNVRYPAQSIMLGYDHYTSYLNKIYQFLVNDEKGNNEKTITNELQSDKTFDKRWYYYFFTHHIDIIGLDLSVSEIHLWWLLNYRSKMQKRKGVIKNTINYFLPSYELLLKKDDIDLLQSFGVTIKEIHTDFRKGKFYEGFYDKFIERYI